MRVVTPSVESEAAESPDAVLSALGHEYRRTIFRSLSTADDGTMQVTALINEVARRAQRAESSGTKSRQRVGTAVRHIHLPKLDSLGLVRYDPETGQVERVSSALLQDLRAVLERYETTEK